MKSKYKILLLVYMLSIALIVPIIWMLLIKVQPDFMMIISALAFIIFLGLQIIAAKTIMKKSKPDPLEN